MQAEDRVVLDEGVVEGGARDRTAREADDHDPALEGDDLGGLGVGLAADGVVDHVRAASAGRLLDGTDDVLGAPVDDDVTAQLARHGGFAEYAVADAAALLPAPEALDDAAAAALHIGYQTGWFGLHRRAGLEAGETLLVHAAAGGVGSAAVQLGKAAGATVIGVVGGAAKASVARELGCDVVIDRREQDVVAAVKEATGGRGADVIYDPVGGQAYAQSAKAVAFEGRIVVVGFASGSIPSPALNHALVKNYAILGLHWGLYNTRNPKLVQHCHERLTELAARGAIKPLVSERVPLAGAADAVQRVADGVTTGRVAVLPSPENGAAA